jgi:hypothetical protein
MIRALLLIFEPVATWERVFRTQRSLVFVLLANLFPMLILTGAAEGYGLMRWGKYRGEIAHLKLFSQREAVLFEVLQMALYLAIIFACALILKSMCDTFHGRHKYPQAFSTIVHGLSPLFLLRLLDALPSISPWVPWAIGILLSIGVLYQGLPRMMEPDPPHAFGLYLMNSLILLLATGLMRFVTDGYLQGKFGKLQTLIAG